MPAFAQLLSKHATFNSACEVLLDIKPDRAALLLDLCLLTVGHEPLLAHVQVRVSKLLNLQEASAQVGSDKQ
jgi:hypothetical protein